MGGFGLYGPDPFYPISRKEATDIVNSHIIFGELSESDFEEGRRSYKPGSVFILYTDGVTEAMDVKDEMFGPDRLIELVKSLKGRPAKEVVGSLHKAVKDFAGKAQQHDDITIMAIKS